MQSLVESLLKLGMKPPFSFQSSLQTHPSSLSELMRIMNLPNPDFGMLKHEWVFQFSKNMPQGVAYGYDETWFLSCRYHVFKYRITTNNRPLWGQPPLKGDRLKTYTLAKLLHSTALDGADYDHIGDLDYHEGVVFAPIRCKSGDAHVVLALSRDLEVIGYSRLAMSSSDGFCTINPWTGELWLPTRPSSMQNLDVYDVSRFYALLHPQMRSQWGAEVSMNLPKRFSLYNSDRTPTSIRDIQGIAFSRNGRLCVTEWNEITLGYSNYIHIFNALTGTRIADSPEYNFPGDWDEIEGVTIHPSGVMYVAVFDYEKWRTDRFKLYAFTCSDPSCPL